MIELKELCGGYGKKEILKGVNAAFQEGSFIAVVGPNGCGKSTLLKTMANVLPIASGDVLVDGESLKSMSGARSARAIAYLSQSIDRAQMTVGELVLHGRFPHTRFPRVYTAHDRAAAERAMACMGISALASRELSSLSGGMRQSAYIAMALAQESRHVLLDEPTAHLDVSHRVELLRYLRRLAREGKCVVAVLHDLPLAMAYADEVAVMQNGRILMKDTPEKVFLSRLSDTVFGMPLGRAEKEDGYAYYF